MYKIGEFSKIVDISVRTLRYYADYGVLVPSLKDKYTGYKYYDDKNISECEKIKLLKALDFTLDEIIRYRDSLDYNILEEKKKELKMKMYLLKLKCKKLSLMQNKFNKVDYGNIKESQNEKVLRRTYEKRFIRTNIK